MNEPTSWHSYPKVWNLGHAAVRDLLDGPVTVEEKVDGSQFSFGVFGGELKCRSKGQQLVVDAPEKMFVPAIETAKALVAEGKLEEGFTYRAEFLGKPKHNALAYDRVPMRNLILFDINLAEEQYFGWEEVAQRAETMGLDVVPRLYHGNLKNFDMLKDLLKCVSVLGGATVEGVVIKNYAKFGDDKKVLMAKWVREEYKEIQQGEWKRGNPKQNDIIVILGERYRTPARWEKAIQHMREAGKITDTPQDIGMLLKEIGKDTYGECAGEIQEELFSWAWPHIQRKLTGGFPDWYKERLAKKQFGDEA